jgi:hypothetical protein
VYAGRPGSHCNFAAADGKTTSFCRVRYRSQGNWVVWRWLRVQKPGKSQFGTKPASLVTSELAVTFCSVWFRLFPPQYFRTTIAGAASYFARGTVPL